MEKDYCFEMMNITDEQMENYSSKDKTVNHEEIANNFMYYLQEEYSDEELCNLLACAGFIPDMYASDSSEETLFSKLVEALVAEWARRMGYQVQLIKEKSSYEDVNIIIGRKVVVCDAKSFRLGRSQAAPNVKDFLKLEDIRKWRSRHKDSLGGLVTYPDTHEWAKSSDAYIYCSTKDCPTVMLPYVYLAMLLHFKDRFEPHTLADMWDYNRLFPKKLEKETKEGNKKQYWHVIEKELLRILGISQMEYQEYIEKCKKHQMECVKKNYDYIS